MTSQLMLAASVVVLVLLMIVAKRRNAQAAFHGRDLLHSLPQGILVVDAETGMIKAANAAVASKWGGSEAGLVGRPVAQIIHGLPADLRELQAPVEAPGRECELHMIDGGLVRVEVQSVVLNSARRNVMGFLVCDLAEGRFTETRLREQLRRLALLALYDPLTGLPNRLRMNRELARRLESCGRERQMLALFCIDIDNFRNISDSRGQGTGDAALRQIAHQLKCSVSRDDLVLRTGGDEFLVMASGLPDKEAAERIAARLLRSLRAPISADGVGFTVTASIGVTVYPEDGEDAESLLKHADIALKWAKDSGRDRYECFDFAMREEHDLRTAMEQALREAIAHEEFVIEYQPIVDLADGHLVALEALLRWHHPAFGAVPPAQFIPVAEASGSIREIGDWVLREVCRQIRIWSDTGLVPVPVSINVSPRQFKLCRFSAAVATAACDMDIEPSLLRFEITESALMENVEPNMVVLKELKRLGARIEVDDFGTGYSSLAYLKRLPINGLKIDRSFVLAMQEDQNDTAIIWAILGLAASLNLHSVAEGIESAELADGLRRLGCNFGQGNHFGRPMPASQCAGLFAPARDDTRGRLSDATRHLMLDVIRARY